MNWFCIGIDTATTTEDGKKTVEMNTIPPRSSVNVSTYINHVFFGICCIEQTCEKMELLADLSHEFSVSEDQKNDFCKKGHIVLRGVASTAEIHGYVDTINEKVRELNKHTKPVESRDTYGKAFIQIGNVWTKCETVKKFVFSKRFAKIAADLLEVDRVRLYGDQALFKEPHGGHTPWHQDQIYWPLDTNKMITMWMPLVDISAETGSMTFASGTHGGCLTKEVISDASHAFLSDYIASNGIETVNYGEMKAGDATFHMGWTVHSAPSNPTDNMRNVMTIIYYADPAILLEPDSEARMLDLTVWFPGKTPGEIADGPTHPVLYDRNDDRSDA